MKRILLLAWAIWHVAGGAPVFADSRSVEYIETTQKEIEAVVYELETRSAGRSYAWFRKSDGLLVR